MPTETTEEKLARLEAENAALKAKQNVPLTLKVSEKGAVSLYGMGRFPVTLYAEQWNKVLEHGDKIRAFITDPANVRRLATKA
jgi:hypothetical protein